MNVHAWAIYMQRLWVRLIVDHIVKYKSLVWCLVMKKRIPSNFAHSKCVLNLWKPALILSMGLSSSATHSTFSFNSFRRCVSHEEILCLICSSSKWILIFSNSLAVSNAMISASFFALSSSHSQYNFTRHSRSFTTSFTFLHATLSNFGHFLHVKSNKSLPSNLSMKHKSPTRPPY